MIPVQCFACLDGCYRVLEDCARPVSDDSSCADGCGARLSGAVLFSDLGDNILVGHVISRLGFVDTPYNIVSRWSRGGRR